MEAKLRSSHAMKSYTHYHSQKKKRNLQRTNLKEVASQI